MLVTDSVHENMRPHRVVEEEVLLLCREVRENGSIGDIFALRDRAQEHQESIAATIQASSS